MHWEKSIQKKLTENETWNTCRICGYKWKDDVPTKGLLHRTTVCDMCQERKE